MSKKKASNKKSCSSNKKKTKSDCPDNVCPIKKPVSKKSAPPEVNTPKESLVSRILGYFKLR